MNKVRICFSANGLASDEAGLPCPSGIQIDLGETEKEIDYAALTKDISIPEILAYVGLDGIVNPEDVKVISPEEYDRCFGDVPFPVFDDLKPSFHGEDCPGNGEHPGIECQCDECDFYLQCFPDWKELQNQGL